MTDEARFDADRNITTFGGRRLVFHCHHYNAFLQRTIDEALGEDAADVQRRAAMESTRLMVSDLFASDGGAPFQARLARAASVFGSLGFGLADVSALGELGGLVALRTSHYAIGWQAKFGAASAPVCHFAVGFWAGVVAAASGHSLERVTGVEQGCAAVSEGPCSILIEVL